MMLCKETTKKQYGSRGFTVCALMVLSVLLVVPSPGRAASESKTVAGIALYRGADREKILIEGAKKEGQLTVYNTNSHMNDVVTKEFEKKYPFIKVSSWRSDGGEQIKRVMEEFAARRFAVDAMESNIENLGVLYPKGILQEYYTPEVVYYKDEAKLKGKTGVYLLPDREVYISLGFNTKLVSPDEAPKSLKDLLDPRWKGKMAIAGTGTGSRWIGSLMDAMGRDFIEKLSRQDIKVHNISGSALAGLIVAGEVWLSPTIFYSNILMAKAKGAPVEWKPLEPVLTNVGCLGISTRAPHPHAALLYLNYIQSKEGQAVVMKGVLGSAREDIKSIGQKFKKDYLHSRYSPEGFEKAKKEWDVLLQRLFIRKR